MTHLVDGTVMGVGTRLNRADGRRCPCVRRRAGFGGMSRFVIGAFALAIMAAVIVALSL